MLLKGVIVCFKSTYFILSTYKGSHFGIYMLPFCGVPSMFGLRTRDHLQWVQIASDERHMGLTSISDEHQTSFKLDQVLVSYHIRRMRQGPHRSALRVFRSEFTITDLFTWLQLTSHGIRRCFRWASKSVLSLPESVWGQMGFRCFSDVLQMMASGMLGNCQDRLAPMIQTCSRNSR